MVTQKPGFVRVDLTKLKGSSESSKRKPLEFETAPAGVVRVGVTDVTICPVVIFGMLV